MASHFDHADVAMNTLSTPVDVPDIARPVALPPPIFVLGAHPVNTALIGAMLGRNSAAFEFPHLNLFVTDTLEGLVTEMVDDGQSYLHGLLRAVAYIYGGEQTIISVGMARRWIMRRLSRSTSQVFDELRKGVEPLRLVDKSAMYSRDATCLERILNAMPGAYFVHVVEHPLSPGAAIGQFKRDPPNAHRRRARDAISSRGQLQWLQVQRIISDALNDVAPDRLVVLRMESLLADPHREISDLCARLDLPNDEVTVADMLHPENSPFAGIGPVGANLGDDPAFLRDPRFSPERMLSLSARSPHGSKKMLPEVAQLAVHYDYH